MALAFCPQAVSQTPQDFGSSETRLAASDSCFPASLSARSFPLTPACPGQYIHRHFGRCMLNIGACQSGLPIPLFTFCIKLTEFMGMIACYGLTFTARGNPAEGTFDCLHLHWWAGGWDLTGVSPNLEWQTRLANQDAKIGVTDMVSQSGHQTRSDRHS